MSTEEPSMEKILKVMREGIKKNESDPAEKLVVTVEGRITHVRRDYGGRNHTTVGTMEIRIGGHNPSVFIPETKVVVDIETETAVKSVSFRHGIPLKYGENIRAYLILANRMSQPYSWGEDAQYYFKRREAQALESAYRIEVLHEGRSVERYEETGEISDIIARYAWQP